ncbi:MAG: DUF4838 domain-containing protein [Lentisphaerae bacterium]|nr:DUF4838 domain-containing protein [Lentisphaerota bacterium]
MISADPARPRMVNLAALELQYYIEKMSGARLPVLSEPGAAPVKLYVGRSPYTDALGVKGGDLQFGAFKMVSGDQWLVLLGDDFDFTPPEPWNTNNGNIPQAVEAWDQIVGDRTDTAWGYPFSLMYKHFWNSRDFNAFVTNRYGPDSLTVWNPRQLTWSRDYQGPGGGQGFWEQDEGGSLNAVYALLRALNVRWYMPEEIGEVVPERKSLPLPDVDKTERPDFELRSWFWYNYGMFPFEHVMWARRLGMNSGFETWGYGGHAHGLTRVHGRSEMQAKHPDYYALRDGKRETEFRGTGHVCFSSEGFFKETVNYARFMFDHYNVPMINIWPQDGFMQCGCEECRKLPASDLVWGFVDRVGRELYHTHPDRIVACGAYTPYIHPPRQVESFTPNVAVFIANCGRPLFDDPVRWNAYWDRVEGWRAKTAPGNILRVENNRSGLHRKFPVLHPRNMAKDLKALKGIARGECDEEAQSGGRWHAPGIDHLTLYVQARFLWDADQDLNAMLNDYYTLFYGPARDDMRAAFEFAEATYRRTDASNRGRCDVTNVSLPDRIRFMELLQAARAKAGDTLYGRRIQLIMDELPPVETLREELAAQLAKGNPRDQAAVVAACHVKSKTNAASYTFMPDFSNWRLNKESPPISTTFGVRWEEKALHFDIRCEEPDMAGLNVADEIWNGDSVVILLEPPGHSYYHIEVDPDGRIHDADHAGGGRVIPQWTSMAEAKTEKSANAWQVHLRVPIALAGSEGAEGDPMNYVVGPEPGTGGDWYFNLARRRIHAGETNRHYKSITAVYPKGNARTVHDPDTFSRLEFAP